MLVLVDAEFSRDGAFEGFFDGSLFGMIAVRGETELSYDT